MNFNYGLKIIVIKNTIYMAKDHSNVRNFSTDFIKSRQLKFLDIQNSLKRKT